MENNCCAKCGYLISNHKFKDDKYNCPEISIEVKPEGVGGWETQLEYAFPKYLEDYDKEVITNNVRNLLLQEKAKWELEADTIPHNTAEGYCCACGYDICKLNEIIQDIRNKCSEELAQEYQRGYNDCAVAEGN